MPIKQEGEENAKSKATRKASSRGLSLVLHTIQDKEGKERKCVFRVGGFQASPMRSEELDRSSFFPHIL